MAETMKPGELCSYCALVGLDGCDRPTECIHADQLAQARREGIEAAAKVCDEAGWSAHPTELAAAIRALPVEPDQ